MYKIKIYYGKITNSVARPARITMPHTARVMYLNNNYYNINKQNFTVYRIHSALSMSEPCELDYCSSNPRAPLPVCEKTNRIIILSKTLRNILNFKRPKQCFNIHSQGIGLHVDSIGQVR